MPELLVQLRKQLDEAETTRDRVDALNELAEHYRTVSDRETRRLADEALSLAEGALYFKGIADAQNNLAWCDLISGQQNLALERVIKVEDMARDDATLAGALGKALSIHGLIFLHVGDLPLAMETLFKALEVAQRERLVNLEGGITSDIGIIYLETENYSRALEQFFRSLQIFESVPELSYRGLVPLINICCVYIEQDDYDMAEVYARRALAVCDIHDALGGRGSALANLGEIHHKRGDFDAAWENYCQALVIGRECNDHSLMVTALTTIGELKLDQKEPDQALVYLTEAYDLAIEHEALLYLANVQRLLSRSYEEQGDFAQALAMHKQYFETKQRLFSHANDARLKIIQTMYEVEAARHEREILRLRNAALEREIAEREQTEAERLERERLQIELESEHKLNAMKTRVMVRIAHEFRTPLSVILTTTQLLTRYFDRISTEERARYEGVIREEVQHLADMLDDITVVLRTTSDTQLSFQPIRLDLNRACDDALVSFAHAHPEARRITKVLNMQGQIGRVDPQLLKCTINGVLDNALKFSSPDSPVEFRARRDGGDLIITVTDHGIGIPADDHENVFLPFHRSANVGEVSGMGLGLAIVKDCVARHNGTIRVDSTVGYGTTVLIRLDVGAPVPSDSIHSSEAVSG